VTILPNLPGLGGTAPPPDPANSRYAGAPVITRRLPDGRTVSYRGRRFVPPADRLATLLWHVVEPGDRLDSLAARYYGDSLLWWRIADANDADDPDEMLVPGRRLRITHPEGVDGVPL
jgi:nucleoid-associated protein YgaU